MIFSSIIYILFLSIVAIVYYLFPVKFRWIWLLVASIAYYLSFIPIFIFLLLGIILVNYFLALWLAKIPEEKCNRFFVFIIFLNILILAFFKYFNIFFPGNQLELYNFNLFSQSDPISKVMLPLGLSYLTFTVLSYQIEVKRKTIKPEKHVGYFSLFLTFFPKIAQGPIERPQQLISQLHQHHPFNHQMIIEGLKLMLWGYFKKLVIADRLAIYVNAVYSNNEHHNGITLLVATVFFAFQIYADFSGYTDIALGSAKLFGFNLTNNFNRPYFAASIKDFWNRWHITFSTWIRDYIFLPLAYSLASKMKKQTYLLVSAEKWIYAIAITVTFAICGIWHGVGWTYLIWGILFGIYLTYSNWTRDLQKKFRKRLKIRKTSRYYIFYKILLTFTLVLFTWVFFRSDNLTDATSILKKIASFDGPLFFDRADPSSFLFSIFGVLFLIIAEAKEEYFKEKLFFFTSNKWYFRLGSYAFLIILILLIGVFDGGQFIYFQF